MSIEHIRKLKEEARNRSKDKALLKKEKEFKLREKKRLKQEHDKEQADKMTPEQRKKEAMLRMSKMKTSAMRTPPPEPEPEREPVPVPVPVPVPAKGLVNERAGKSIGKPEREKGTGKPESEPDDTQICQFTDYAGVLHGFNLRLYAHDIWIGNPIYKGNEAYRQLMADGGRAPIVADKGTREREQNNSYFLSCRRVR